MYFLSLVVNPVTIKLTSSSGTMNFAMMGDITLAKCIKN